MKHAYKVRDATGVKWSIGALVEVTKPGSQLGKKALVKVPDWHGRIQVRMELGDNVTKVRNQS
jgi:hypothetical protein